MSQRLMNVSSFKVMVPASHIEKAKEILQSAVIDQADRVFRVEMLSSAGCTSRAAPALPSLVMRFAVRLCWPQRRPCSKFGELRGPAAM